MPVTRRELLSAAGLLLVPARLLEGHTGHMTGFSNPLVGGGGALVYPSIHSPNFVTGVSGWTIKKDGSAEFNNLSIRGTFFGTNFEIHSNGAFFYSGTPAAGNLSSSIASALTTDRFGNAVLPGQASYNTGVSPIQATQIFTGAVALYTAATEAGPYSLIGQFALTASAADVQISGQGSTSNSNIDLFPGFAKAVIVSANGSSGQNASVFEVINGLAAPTSPASQLIAAAAGDKTLGIIVTGDTNSRMLVDSNGKQSWGSGAATQDASLGRVAAGVLGVASNIQAVVGGVQETWHNLGAPIAGWTANVARYKMLADSGLVLVELVLTGPAVPPVDGTTIFVAANGLPAGYRPTITDSTLNRICYINQGSGGEMTALSFVTDGSIQVLGVGGTGAGSVLGCQTLISTI